MKEHDVGTWQKMSHKRKDQLTDTAQNFFHLLEQIEKLKRTHCICKIYYFQEIKNKNG